MTQAIGIAANLSTIVTIALMGRKVWWAPVFGLATQFVWGAYVAALGWPGWPILMSAGFAAAVYALTIPKWRRERNMAEDAYDIGYLHATAGDSDSNTIPWDQLKAELHLGEASGRQKERDDDSTATQPAHAGPIPGGSTGQCEP